MKLIPPSAILGILGGGQLARMTALAAARLGYRCHIFCPETEAPALDVAAFHTCADFGDAQALEAFAKSVAVVTLEWENVPREALDIIARHVEICPKAKILEIAQDRRLEKLFARDIGVGTAVFTVIESEGDLVAALKDQKGPALLKTARMGYDGKGQVRLDPVSSEAEAALKAAQAWAAVGGVSCVLEQFVNFSDEVSVIVARRADGASACYPVVRNIHKNQILDETHYPSGLSGKIEAEARDLALLLAEKLDLVGLLAVEMFVLKTPDEKGRSVLMNEIAPRPHNSGHWTIDACACGQFEQLVRAICGLPLGGTKPHSKAVMRNLLGDEAADWGRYLSNPDACLHLYGKKESRKGRKMGHVTFLS